MNHQLSFISKRPSPSPPLSFLVIRSMATARNALPPSNAGASSAIPSSLTVVCDACKKPCVDIPSLCALSLAESAASSSSLLQYTHPLAPEKHGHAGRFDCSICLEECYEPVVTLCGHLFCWPCLYCWLSLHAVSQECPVCKASVRHGKIVPVYGRSEVEQQPMHLTDRRFPGIEIPSRPGYDYEIDQQNEMTGLVLRWWGSRHAALSTHVGFFASLLKWGTTLLLPTGGGFLHERRWARTSASSTLLRPITKRELLLHWAFVCVASIASLAFILMC